jgi:hypothetical protein
VVSACCDESASLATRDDASARRDRRAVVSDAGEARVCGARVRRAALVWFAAHSGRCASTQRDPRTVNATKRSTRRRGTHRFKADPGQIQRPQGCTACVLRACNPTLAPVQWECRGCRRLGSGRSNWPDVIARHRLGFCDPRSSVRSRGPCR